jgi:hypothetical protein
MHVMQNWGTFEMKMRHTWQMAAKVALLSGLAVATDKAGAANPMDIGACHVQKDFIALSHKKTGAPIAMTMNTGQIGGSANVVVQGMDGRALNGIKGVHVDQTTCTLFNQEGRVAVRVPQQHLPKRMAQAYATKYRDMQPATVPGAVFYDKNGIPAVNNGPSLMARN